MYRFEAGERSQPQIRAQEFATSQSAHQRMSRLALPHLRRMLGYNVLRYIKTLGCNYMHPSYINFVSLQKHFASFYEPALYLPRTFSYPSTFCTDDSYLP
jgi:hypothetical protein